MAITLPTTQEFYDFWGDEADDVDEDRAQLLIELAADLLYLATNLETDPKDVRVARLVKYAICDMAIYIYVTRDDVNSEYSPFQSERIGSYSYSKTYSHITRQVVWNEPTGVPLFDRVVSELTDSAAYDAGTVIAGENVVQPGYKPLWADSRFGNPNQDGYPYIRTNPDDWYIQFYGDIR